MAGDRFDPEQEAEDLLAALQAISRLERAEGERKYLKSQLRFLGVQVPEIRRITHEFLRSHPDLTHAMLVALVEALWKTDVHELHGVAIVLLDQRAPMLEAADVPMLERLLRSSDTWAYVDPISSIALGSLVERHPSLRETLELWSQDPDFWIRRSALLALLGPLKRGDGDFAFFEQLAAPLLTEREFFIRKAIGWILRETSKKRPDLVRDFLTRHLDAVSGLTLREGAKYLSEADRSALLARYNTRRKKS